MVTWGCKLFPQATFDPCSTAPAANIVLRIQVFGARMKFFEFLFVRTRARQTVGDGPPKAGGVLEALRRSPLIGAGPGLTRENRWDDWFKNGPRVSGNFMRDREQPPAEEREPL
jgi:hypothetical protein